MQEQFIKIYQFELAENTSEKDFLLASEEMNEFLKAYAGFQYRSVAKQGAGVWQDIVYFDSQATAKKVDADFMAREDSKCFMSLIDASTVIITESHVSQNAYPEQASNETDEALAESA